MREKLSALIDGELTEHELTQLLEMMKQGQSSVECWREYQLISDALKENSQTLDKQALDSFLARFMVRLAKEPPNVAATPLSRATHWLGRFFAPRLKWQALSIISLLAVLSTSLLWFAVQQEDSGYASLLVAEAEDLPKASLDAYWLAHQELLGNPGANHNLPMEVLPAIHETTEKPSQ